MLFARLGGHLRRPVNQPGDAGAEFPTAANENLLMLQPGEDPAAVLAQMRMIQARMRQENAREGTLLAYPPRRDAYEECRSLERAILWKYFGRR